MAKVRVNEEDKDMGGVSFLWEGEEKLCIAGLLKKMGTGDQKLQAVINGL